MKWEYKILYTNEKYRADKAFEDSLNKLGIDEWQLVGVQANALYFKRPAKAKLKDDEISWPYKRQSLV